MLHDRHRLLMSRETRRNLRRLSRMLGLQNRAFDQSADLMERLERRRLHIHLEEAPCASNQFAHCLLCCVAGFM